MKLSHSMKYEIIFQALIHVLVKHAIPPTVFWGNRIGCACIKHTWYTTNSAPNLEKGSVKVERVATGPWSTFCSC